MDTGTRFWHEDFWDCLRNWGNMWFYNGNQGNHKPMEAYVGHHWKQSQMSKLQRLVSSLFKVSEVADLLTISPIALRAMG